MDSVRNQYKLVSTIEGAFLYPIPVIKNQKYLIQVEEKRANFFIFAFKERLLTSPDLSPNYLEVASIHSDGRTEILEIKYDELYFSFLSYTDEDKEKGRGIETLISKKIINCLKKDEGAEQSLKKVFKNQLNCSTCQKLGISNPLLQQLIEMITIGN